MKNRFKLNDMVTNGKSTGIVKDTGELTGKYDSVVPAVNVWWGDGTKTWEEEKDLKEAFK